MSILNSLGSADYVAIGLVVAGLVAVVWEIAAKSPRSFIDMLTDTRSFAERPLSDAGSAATPRAAAEPVTLRRRAVPQAQDRRLAA
jgi:hypothetical protein